jgi:hypothetical protein
MQLLYIKLFAVWEGFLASEVRGADGSIKPGALAPGPRPEKRTKPAKRATAASFGVMLGATAITRFAGSNDILAINLVLTPQALCSRPLRGGLKTTPLTSRPTKLLRPGSVILMSVLSPITSIAEEFGGDSYAFISP